jgi:hypothetical protein
MLPLWKYCFAVQRYGNDAGGSLAQSGERRGNGRRFGRRDGLRHMRREPSNQRVHYLGLGMAYGTAARSTNCGAGWYRIGPMAGVLLDNMGADVIRVDRIEPHETDRMVDRKYMVNRRNKRSVCTDVRREGGVGALLRLASSADGFIDPYRPGVGERFGIGSEVCTKLNPRLVHGRITSWGQQGPLAGKAGQDINYIADCNPACDRTRSRRPLTPKLINWAGTKPPRLWARSLNPTRRFSVINLRIAIWTYDSKAKLYL